jgi:hypothetical protein
MNVNDMWGADDFEDTVAKALITCYETKVLKSRGSAPWDRLSIEHVQALRRAGPYIASNSRFVTIRGSDDGREEFGDVGVFDVNNDPLPIGGVLAHPVEPGSRIAEEWKDAYFHASHVRQVKSMARFWRRRSGGVLYELVDLLATPKGVTGDRRYFAVTKQGDVVACTPSMPNVMGYKPGVKIETIEESADWLKNVSWIGALALQGVADRRFCWAITASEKEAKAHLGCMQEEIKSLLYARSLPLSSTGRKRPILHLVEAHKRRIRNGTDVDVTAFLRGQQTVEIGGTLFSVRPPEVIYPDVSRNSQRKFFGSDADA